VSSAPRSPQLSSRREVDGLRASPVTTNQNDFPSRFARSAGDGLNEHHGAVSRLIQRVRNDSLVRNSLYLVFSSGLQASLSFIFWIIAARLFTTEETGRAGSLISATVFIMLVALMGLNTSFIRYLPTAKNRDALVTGGLTVVAICGLVLASLYVVVVPVIAPRLAFVAHSLPLAVGFILLTATASVNPLTDAVFIGSHKSGFIPLTDGAIAGAAKIGVLVLLAGSGAFGLYSASTTGLAAAALASVALFAVRLRWRPTFRNSLQALRPLARFSSASYASELIGIVPQSVMPIIVLDRLGPSAAAYYYLSYQVAALSYSTVFAVQSTMLAEGSRAHANLRNLVRRTIRLTLMVSMPVMLGLALCGHWILLVFGTKYSAHGTFALIVLAATAMPIAAVCLMDVVLRLLGRLRVLVWSSVLSAIACCSLAWLLAPHGLVAATAAWPISMAVGALAGGASLLHRPPVVARHRRSDHFSADADTALSPWAGAGPARNFAEVQQAGLAALLSLSIVGNTAPIGLRVADFTMSSVSLGTEGKSPAAHGRTRLPPRHSSRVSDSDRRSLRESPAPRTRPPASR
jgi:O-antigen/teichoic acid export membrane protein